MPPVSDGARHMAALAVLGLLAGGGVVWVLAFGPRHPVLSPVPSAAAVMATTSQSPVTQVPVSSAVPASGCWMFCDEPPLPPADANGCRLFCDLQRPSNDGSDR